MSNPFQHPLRVAVRVLWLASEIVLALVRFAALIVRQGGIPDRAARTRWLQGVCRRALRVFKANLHVTGPIPYRGLLVCNHLSYVDVLVLAATTPCVFVSKCEVRRWPVFGWFASLAGTLFLRREKRSDVARMTLEMGRVLDEGELVVLFPKARVPMEARCYPSNPRCSNQRYDSRMPCRRASLNTV